MATTSTTATSSKDAKIHVASPCKGFSASKENSSPQDMNHILTSLYQDREKFRQMVRHAATTGSPLVAKIDGSPPCKGFSTSREVNNSASMDSRFIEGIVGHLESLCPRATVDVVHISPPCSGFSKNSAKRHRLAKDTEDEEDIVDKASNIYEIYVSPPCEGFSKHSRVAKENKKESIADKESVIQSIHVTSPCRGFSKHFRLAKEGFSECIVDEASRSEIHSIHKAPPCQGFTKHSSRLNKEAGSENKISANTTKTAVPNKTLREVSNKSASNNSNKSGAGALFPWLVGFVAFLWCAFVAFGIVYYLVTMALNDVAGGNDNEYNNKMDEEEDAVVPIPQLDGAATYLRGTLVQYAKVE